MKKKIITFYFLDCDKTRTCHHNKRIYSIYILKKIKQFCLQKNDKWRRNGTKFPKNGEEFWGFNEDADEDSCSVDEDEENSAGFKPILKVNKNYWRI